MDRTRRIMLVAGGASVAALLLLRNGAVSSGVDADDGAVKVVRGAGAAPFHDATAPSPTAEVAAWQAEIGRPLGLFTSAGQRLEVAVAAVTPFDGPRLSANAQAGGWWDRLSGRTDRIVAPPATALATTRPAGVRANPYSVLIEVRSGIAPAADTILSLDRSIDGLAQVFVQPATAQAGKPMVVAYFG